MKPRTGLIPKHLPPKNPQSWRRRKKLTTKFLTKKMKLTSQQLPVSNLPRSRNRLLSQGTLSNRSPTKRNRRHLRSSARNQSVDLAALPPHHSKATARCPTPSPAFPASQFTRQTGSRRRLFPRTFAVTVRPSRPSINM